MKWPGEDPNLINLNSQPTAHGHNPPRTQDDAMIGYVFQRGTGEAPEFPPNNVPLPGKLPGRWALGNEELMQVKFIYLCRTRSHKSLSRITKSCAIHKRDLIINVGGFEKVLQLIYKFLAGTATDVENENVKLFVEILFLLF